MKKLLFALLLCFITSYAVQAQTKEETITWLQEKLQKYIYYDYYGWKAEDISVKVSECSITVQYTLIEPPIVGNQKYHNQYYIVPTTGLYFDQGGRDILISMKDEVASIRNKERGNDEELTKYIFMYITPGEEKLKERLQKAVDHLATFCPKKQETF